MTQDRRRLERLPVGFYALKLTGDDLQRWFATDLSPIGAFLERPRELTVRHTNVVALDIPLPGLGDSLWVRGEIVRDCMGTLFHGSAVQFTGMARRHQRWLREWLREYRRVPNRRAGALNIELDSGPSSLGVHTRKSRGLRLGPTRFRNIWPVQAEAA